MRAYESEDLTLLRLPQGTDIYQGVTEAAKEQGIRAAQVTVIGALRNLEYGCYDQQAREYTHLTHEGELEIASANGNISLRDGEPFLHMHIVAGKADGSTIGGHLFGGEIFVAEVAFHLFRGEPPVRELDEEIGLPMWPTR